jgi:prepilin-type N-terminal cleavage/methylation domain-containing protein
MGTSLSERKKGFTIIELCIVILVLAILTAIAGEAVFNYRKGARDSERRADVTVISQAFEHYYRTQSVAIGVTYPPSTTPVADLVAIIQNQDAVRAPDQADDSLVIATNSNLQYPGVNQYVYQPLNADDTLCSSAPCIKYKLYFRLEETDEVIVKDSMRQQ